MKQLFAGAALLVLTSLPAAASSIELIDQIITGAKGSKSIITLGEPVPCAETACVDASGGDPKLNTASAQQQAAVGAMPPREINFEFARKFPDPANPVASTAPATAEPAGLTSLEVPKAPADAGTIAPQPPVSAQQPPAASPEEQANDTPPGQQRGNTAPPVAQQGATRGSIDPNAPKMPIISSEMREGE